MTEHTNYNQIHHIRYVWMSFCSIDQGMDPIPGYQYLILSFSLNYFEIQNH